MVAAMANRKRLIRFIRGVDPDLVLGPRPNDYHPDHRYCAQLLRDAAYMLTVPNVCQDVDPMTDNPDVRVASVHVRRTGRGSRR